MATKSCPECDQQVRKYFYSILNAVTNCLGEVLSAILLITVHSHSRIRGRKWGLVTAQCTRVNTPNPSQRVNKVSFCYFV